MKANQLREAIRSIIKKELNENSPAPSKPAPSPGPTTLPGKPGVKPDEKRRKIGNPSVKPAPKNIMKEEEMVNKIVKRFKSKKPMAEGNNTKTNFDATRDRLEGKLSKAIDTKDWALVIEVRKSLQTWGLV
jgi:hypothetical protein